MSEDVKKVAILLSGRGSNFAALSEAIETGKIPARIVLVFSNRPEAQGLEKARQKEYPTACIPPEGSGRESYDRLVVERTESAIASLDPVSLENIAVQLRNLEFRSRLANAVPAKSTHHAFDVVGKIRRSVKPAGRQIAEPRAHEGRESADVIRVRVADEHVAHLVHHPRRQALRIAEIKQQAAPLVAQPKMQQ